MQRNVWLGRRVLNIAHQGGELEAPPNTLFAFKTAVGAGADLLELDVHATAEGELVVIHDETVDRTTNGSGRIDAMTLEQVRALDAAHLFVPGRGIVAGLGDDAYPFRGVASADVPPPEAFDASDFRVPTLREVLDAFPRTFVNIDIKQTAPQTRPYERTLADLLARYERADDVIVASFHDDAIAPFRARAPHVTTAASPTEALGFWRRVQHAEPAREATDYEALQLPAVLGELEVITPELVHRAHDEGVAVHVWTIDRPDRMHSLIEAGVDGIVTNVPSVLEQVVRARGVAYEGRYDAAP